MSSLLIILDFCAFPADTCAVPVLSVLFDNVDSGPAQFYLAERHVFSHGSTSDDPKFEHKCSEMLCYIPIRVERLLFPAFF